MVDRVINLRDGSVRSIEHLAPGQTIQCPCEQIGRQILISVDYANHCYTENFDDAVHAREDILLYDAPERPRVFCPIRYQESLSLPDLIKGLPNAKVFQTSEIRNYVHVVPVEIEDKIYEVYLMLQRAPPGAGADLRMTIESAYLADKVDAKRHGKIRFFVLAHKVLTNQPIKFAAR